MKSQAILSNKSPQIGKRHLEVMDELEIMLDQGKSFSTMSDLAKKLKISLRTLYEIAPSKEELIVTTVDRVLKKHGKIATDAMNAHSSPIKKLECFLTVTNQAVGPRFERFRPNVRFGDSHSLCMYPISNPKSVDVPFPFSLPAPISTRC